MAEWARSVSLEKLPAVFKYLIEGELGQAIADKLGREWLDNRRKTNAFNQLTEEQRGEIERKFFKGLPWPSRPPLVISPTHMGHLVQRVMDPDDAFLRVYEWWEQDQDYIVADYEEKMYPPGFLGELPWPDEDEWDEKGDPSPQARWLLLFIHAALVPLGFNMIGRDQSFSKFLLSSNLLEVFANVSNEPEKLLPAIDQYLDRFIHDTQFHFQMRQFITFYAAGKNLVLLLQSLREAERAETYGAFNMVFSPRASSILTGTGIEAPPLTGMLGMGSCYLLRELYRLGRLSNPLGYPFAFTPIRKVRRLCAQLFGTSEKSSGATSSIIIFSELDRLGKIHGKDATFSHCFDLPFQFLAENPAMRKDVLRVEFEAEAEDSVELDAAPQWEVTP